jgi:hypothetical protein
MKLNLLLPFITICLSYNIGFGQFKRNNLSINLGLHHTHSYTKFYYTRYINEGLNILNQQSTFERDFNIIYNQSLVKSKLSFVYGLGLNRKGFNEEGLESDGTGKNYYNYTQHVSWLNIPIYLGINYKILEKRKTEVSVSQILVPEFYIFSSRIHKFISFSSRTNIVVAYAPKGNRKFLFTTFFQSSITKYNKDKLHNKGSDYWPYSYGINLGISLKK